MINKVTIMNSYGEELTMALRNPKMSGYAITNITGLDPVQVDIKQTQMVSGLRYKYNKGFFKYRTIQLSIIYYEYNILRMGVVELRNNLYKYFKTNDFITIRFEKDNEMYAIQGYVDKHESQIFTSQGGATISITCPDPWFKKRGIDYQDEVLADCVKGVDSDNYINTAVISYDGNIGNGFTLETETDVRNLIGEELVLESRRDGQVTGTLVLNIPKNYPDTNVTIDSLGISLIKDSLSVYTEHIGGLQYFLSGFGTSEWVDEDTSELLSHTIVCEIDGVNDALEVKAHIAESAVNKITESDTNMFLLYSTDSRLPKSRNIKVTVFDQDNNTSYTMKCTPCFVQGLNAYTLLITNAEDINLESFKISDVGGSYNYALGYIASDKVWLDEDRPNNGGTQSEPVDHIGWVDATSISKRTPLPRLEPGYNTVSLNTSSGRPVQFKIKYNTLYRGL